VPVDAADVLEDHGILTDPHSILPHPHAAAKAIENKLLSNLGEILKPHKTVTHMYLKRSKLNILRRKPTRDVFQNMHWEPRDASRYDEPSTVPHHVRIETAIACIYDTLHFKSQKWLIDLFTQNPVLDTVYATMVLPVEAVYRHRSLEPSLYTLTYNYDGYQYLPGGHAGGSYHHEFAHLSWLQTGYISYKGDGPDGLCITAQLLESIGANHMFVFKRGRMLTPRVRTFRADEYVKFPQIFHPEELNSTQPMRKTLAMQLLMYVRSVKDPSKRDIYAKMRQLIPTKELQMYSPVELTHVVNFFRFTAKLPPSNTYDAILGMNILSSTLLPIKSRIVKVWERITGASRFQQLMKVLQWETVPFAFEVKDIQVNCPLSDCLAPLDERTPDEEEGEEGPADPPQQGSSPKTMPTQASAGDFQEALNPWAAWLPVLNAHGFEGNRLQRDPRGELIVPVTDTKTLPSIPTDTLPAGLAKRLNSNRRLPTNVQILSSRAAPYASDIKNGRVGAFYRTLAQDFKDGLSLKAEAGDRTIVGVVVHGAGGSGKSRFLQEWCSELSRDDNTVTIVLPTNELRSDWTRKVPSLDHRRFKTFEKALAQNAGQVVIFDDYGKLPAGYIETYLFAHSNVQLIVLTGDPRQTVHHEPNSQAASSMTLPGIDYFDQYSRFYINATHRNRKDVANALGVYSELEARTPIEVKTNIASGSPVLCPTTIKQQALLDMGHRAMTYSSCQGLTAGHVQILIDSNTPLCCERTLYTALSRASEAITFVNASATERDFTNKLAVTPYLKTFIEFVRDDLLVPADEKPQEPVVVEAAPTTHFPVENAKLTLGEIVEELPEKHQRELFSSDTGHSNCVQTDDAVVQLFAHQQAKDETLLWETIRVRLSISTPEQNLKELSLKKDIGDLLFFNYRVAMKLPAERIPFDQALWNSCRAEVEHTFLSKPVAMLINSQLRQSPDFPHEKIALFLKSQWVKKVEKLGCLKIKAGQTIAAFMQETVMLYGTMARYMRRMRQVYQPPNILISCEQTPDDLNEFVTQRWKFNRHSHENDFTAFDQSQDGAMLQFELLKAKHHSIPEDIIEGYTHLKLNASTFLGTLAIMRLTGEGPTFDANTECSIAYHHTRFHVPSDVNQMYAGDDMVQDAPAIEKASFAMIRNRLSLTSKTVLREQKPGDYASFCGWRLTPIGLIKDPLKLHAGLLLASKTARYKETAVAYALDLSYAYRHGDALHQILTPKESEYHQATVRMLTLSGHGYIMATGVVT
jgi:hypothetical protein